MTENQTVTQTVYLPHHVVMGYLDSLQAWGIRFKFTYRGAQNASIIEAELPKGWSAQPGHVANCVEIRDEHQRPRAHSFLRLNGSGTPHTYLIPRFTIETTDEPPRAALIDGLDRSIVFEAQTVEEVIAWRTQNLPDWSDPAHWSRP